MKKFNQVFKRDFAVLIVFALFVSFNVKAEELENATGLTDNLATETEEKEREVELAPPAESTGETSSVDESQYQSTAENVGETVDVLPEANEPTDANEEDKSEPTTQEVTPPNSVTDVTVPPTSDGTDIDVTDEPTIVDETNGTTNVETDPVVETGTVTNEPTPVVEPSVDETSNNEVDPLPSDTEEVLPTEESNEEPYKVYFTYSGYSVNIIGEETVLVSNLLRTLNINIDLENIENVVFENNELIKITKMINGDWAIESLSPFDTSEKLYIYTKDGIEYQIDVTDPPVAPEHHKELTPNTEVITTTDPETGETITTVENDGTYNLSLTVTGDADPTQEVDGSVNVLIVYDSSSSMEHWYAVSETGSYGHRIPFPGYNDNQQNGGYVPLYSRDENGTYTELAVGSNYEGKVYTRSGNNYTEYLPWRTYNTGNYGRDTAPTDSYSAEGYFSLYKSVGDGKYEKIQAGDTASTVYRYDGTTYTVYTGTRYANFMRYSSTRAAAAEKAIREFVDSLTAYNKTPTATNVEIAFVTFSSYENSATYVLQSWTNNKEGQISNRLSDTLNGKILNYHTGTNYEKALQVALGAGALAAADGDQTFVIFMTDGQPSQSLSQVQDGISQSTVNPYGDDHDGRYTLYTQVLDEIQQVANYNTGAHNSTTTPSNTTLYGIYAFGKEDDFLDDLIYYGKYGVERNRADITYETNNTGIEDLYFNAGNTQELQTAISKIFKNIADALGITSVSIADGTTSSVKVTQGDSEGLLTVDPTTFEYWLSWDVTEDTENSGYYKFDMLNYYDKAVVTYYAKNDSNGVVISKGTIDGASFTVDGAISAVSVGDTATKNVLKLLWGRSGNSDENLDINLLEANKFYYAAPRATFGPDTNNNDFVNWDLSGLGTLLSGVTYEVTFDVWPSQTTLDLIADIKNDPSIYDTLNSEVKKYLTQDGRLYTNTGAKVYYKDKRVDDVLYNDDYDEPNPVPTSLSEMLVVTKKWINNLDEEKGNNPITINIMRDNETTPWNTISLPVLDEETGENVFSDKRYIAVGIITVHNGVATIKTTGHDYSFGEVSSDSYYWELKSDTVRPMLINSKLTMLYKDVEVDSNGACPTDDNTYYIINGYCYRDGGNNAGSAALTATNERRSYIELTKDVDYEGDTLYPNDIFYFEISVTDKEGEDVWFSVKFTDDPKLEDYVYEKDGLEVTGATAEIKNLESTNTNITDMVYNEETGMISYKYKGTAYEVPYAGEYTNYIYKETSDSTETKVLDTTSVTNLNYDEEAGTITYTDKDGVEHTVYYVGVTDTNYKYYTGYYYATSASTFTVGMKEGWNLRVINLLSGSTYTIAEVNLDQKYELDHVEENGTTLYEVDADGNPTQTEATTVDSGIETSNKAYRYTFVNNLVKINIPVEKKWTVTTDTAPVTIVVMNGEKEVASVTLNGREETPWHYTFVGLDAYDKDGNPITYTIKEVELDGYVSTMTGNVEDGYVITNKPVVDIPVVKEWTPGSERKAVTINLLANGTEVAEITLNGSEATPWHYTFTGLDKYDSTGKKIEYTITEDALEGYNTVVNGYTVTNKELTNVPVEKVWTKGSKTTSVTIRLMNGTTQVGVITLDGTVDVNETVAWHYTFTGLDKYDSEGVEIEYTITEDALDGYNTVINGYTVTNKELTNVPVVKVWTNGSAKTAVTIKLMNGTTQVRTITLDGEVDENETVAWHYTFTGLDKYDSAGTLINYTVEETLEGYSTTITGNVTDGYTVTNKELTEVPVVKVWAPGSTPTTVTIRLMNGTTQVGVITLDGEVDANETVAWHYTFTGLDKYDSTGKKIEYTITEDALLGYESVINGYTVTNTELTDIPVVKEWTNGSAKTAVTINLLADGTKVASITLDGTVDANETVAWHYTFTGLDKYDSTGKKIEYTITEDALPGYNTVINGYTVTNKELTNVPVEKVWTNGSAKTTVTIRLMNGTTQVGTITLDGTVDANEIEAWHYTFTGLDKYDSTGTLINYTVEETLEGYSTTITGSLTNGYTVTNKELTNVPVVKEWTNGSAKTAVTIKLMNGTTQVRTITLDGEVDENETVAWHYTFTGLDKYDSAGTLINYTVEETLEGYSTTITGSLTSGYTVTNKELTNVPVEKVWTKGSKTTSVTIRLMNGTTQVGTITLDGTVDENETVAWHYTFTGLDKYDSTGTLINYTVEETLEGYSTTITGNLTDGYIVTNKELTNVPVVKEWTKGSATTSVTINLLANGTEVAEIVLDGSEEEAWHYTFTGLDKYDSEGVEIEYTITEDELDGYESVVDGLVVINKELTEVPVVKEWGIGSETTAVTINLLANDEVLSSIELDGEEDDDETTPWHYIFTGLDKYDSEGTPIAYTVAEEAINGYRTTITGDATEGYVILNEEVIEIPVEKKWIAGNETTKVTIRLMNGEEEVGNVTLDGSEEEAWHHTFVDLDKYDAEGNEIEYTITEDELEGYETIIEGFVVTNIKLVDATIIKVWDDNDNQDGIRPESLTVQLLADEEEVSDGILVLEENEEGVWTGTITDLAKYTAEGALISYTWKEVDLPEGYELTDTSVEGTITTLTNTHELETTEATVKKVWDDNNNQDGIRPASLKVRLSNGQEVTLNEENNWTATITGLIKYEEGKVGVLVEYTWEEVDLPEGYELTDTSVDGLVTTFTNTHTPEVREIEIIKVWTDFDNKYETRPIQIVVRLYADGKEIKELILDESTEWKATVSELPVYENGKKIIYTVTEDEIELYEAVISGDMDEGFKIENFYSPKGGDNPPPPQTGDNVWMYLITLIVSLVGMGYSFYLKKRYN